MKTSTDLFNSLNSLEDEIKDTYYKLAKGNHYFCDKEFIKETFKDTFEDMNNYGAVEDLEQIYYNRNGYERHGYLLGVIDGHIVIVDSDEWRIVYEDLSDINLINDKINVISNLETI